MLLWGFTVSNSYDNSKDYHKCESWHFCLPVNRVASLHLALMHLHCNVDWFGQLSGPRANLTHQAEEQCNKTLVSRKYGNCNTGYNWISRKILGDKSFAAKTNTFSHKMTIGWKDCNREQNKPCMDTHCVLLLLTGSTVQAVCPSRTWWVREVMAGLKGDWNSHPHNVSSVWPSGGAVRGKNCVNKAEYKVPPWNEMFFLVAQRDVWILAYRTNLTPVIPGGQDSFLQRLWHSLSQEHTPEHQPQPMNLGAVRHMAQVRKCWQPGPRWGTWIIWNREITILKVTNTLLGETCPVLCHY